MFKQIVSYLALSACCLASGPNDSLMQQISIPLSTYPIPGVQFELRLDRLPLTPKKTELEQSLDKVIDKICDLLNPNTLTIPTQNKERQTITLSTLAFSNCNKKNAVYLSSYPLLTPLFLKQQETKDNFFTTQPREIIAEIYSYLELKDFICLANVSRKTKPLAENIFENTNFFEENFPRYTGKSKDPKTYKKLLTRAYSSVELFKRFYKKNKKNEKILSSLKDSLEKIQRRCPESPVNTEVLKELRDFIKKKEPVIFVRTSIFF